MKSILLALFFLSLLPPALSVGEAVVKDLEGMDCYVYPPETIEPGVRYQLVVGVHGAGGNGKGACGIAGWAKRGDVVVIGPSFVAKGERPYQNGDGIHAEKLIALSKTLGQTYHLKEKMFLHGFSGGAQFAHRFAMLHPEHVCGVSAHSAGSWATDGYGEMSVAAKKIPFAISCGENDTAKSFSTAPFNRLEWYGRFRDALERGNYTYLAASWPGVGHSPSVGVTDFAKQCFQISTRLPGEDAKTPLNIHHHWKNLDRGLNLLPRSQIPSSSSTVDEATLDTMARAAFAKADAAEIPSEQLIGFMKRYPPAGWKDKPGSERLLRQCERAAKEWSAAAKAKGLWSEQVKMEFLRFTRGIEIPVDPPKSRDETTDEDGS